MYVCERQLFGNVHLCEHTKQSKHLYIRLLKYWLRDWTLKLEKEQNIINQNLYDF